MKNNKKREYNNYRISDRVSFETYLKLRKEIPAMLINESEEKIKNTLELLEEMIHEEKIGLRNAYRQREKYKDKYNWLKSGNSYDSVLGKWVIDRELTQQEIDELIEDEWEEWYNPYNDGRDCTGVWFTSSIKCFVVPGKTIVYHWKHCDV